MPLANDLSKSTIPLEQDGTVIAVIEMSQSSWLVGGIVSGLERHPLKKLEPDEDALLRLLQRWRVCSQTASQSIFLAATFFISRTRCLETPGCQVCEVAAIWRIAKAGCRSTDDFYSCRDTNFSCSGPKLRRSTREPSQ